MVSKFKSVALAGALAFVAVPLAAPAFAQETGVPVVNQLPLVGDLPLVGNGKMMDGMGGMNMGGLDLDPLHIFTPAPTPAAAAAPAPMMKMHHKKMMMHHKKMMMHHKMMMMHHKKMMMMKKKAM